MAPGTWRFSFDTAHGAFNTTHVAECPDVAPECATETIPPHLHKVRLGVTHYEVSADYGLRKNMQLSLRLPYDIKAQRVHYATLSGAPYVPPYGDIHHRTETLRGISDGTILFDWSPQSQWIFGLGTTLPFGHIVPNPIVLGRLGLKHEHIQFGSGTFEPTIAVQWIRPATVTLFAGAEQRLSLYENREGFRAPSTLIWSLGPSFRAGRISIAPSLNGQYQTLGRWSGEVDEGAGFQNGGLRLQLNAPIGSVVIAPGVYRELWSHGFQGQTFSQGTTWSLTVSRLF